VALRWTESTNRYARPTTILHDDVQSVMGQHCHDHMTRLEWLRDA
jgi:hypothetical protein